MLKRIFNMHKNFNFVTHIMDSILLMAVHTMKEVRHFYDIIFLQSFIMFLIHQRNNFLRDAITIIYLVISMSQKCFDKNKLHTKL